MGREQTDRRERRIWFGIAGAFLLLLAFLVSSYSGHASIALSLFVIAAFALARPHVDRHIDWHVRLRGGTEAEESVGETLGGLRRDGWIVMHDVERPGQANVDHLVCGPNGAYLVETKANAYESSHLGRAKSQAAWLHDELGVWVTPVICIVSRRGRPFRHERVWIVPQSELVAWLHDQAGTPVEFERFARFADKL